jgi:hypothetical protein
MKKCILSLLTVLCTLALFSLEPVPIRRAWYNEWRGCSVKTADNCVIVAWVDSNLDDLDIFAQKYNSFGQPQWQEHARIVVKPGKQDIHQLIATSDNNFVITYSDTYNAEESQLWVQKFNSDGQKLWTDISDYGVQLNTVNYNATMSHAVANAQGGVYVMIRSANPSYSVIGYQLNAFGTNMWDANGQSLFTHTSSIYIRNAVTDFAGGMIIQVDKYNSGLGMSTHLQRISPSGTIIGQNPMIPSSTFPGNVFNISASNEGTYLLTHLDYDSAITFRMQKMDSSGNLLLPGVQSMVFGNTLNYDMGVLTTPTNDGGLVLVWKENPPTSNPQLLIQRLDNNLLPMWQQGGVLLNTDSDPQFEPSISINANNGIWITWIVNTDNIYYDFTVKAQYVNSDGSISFPENTISLSNIEGTKTSPICHAFSDRALFIWKDESGEQTGIKRQALSTSGTAYLAEFGASVISHLSGIPHLHAVHALDSCYLTLWTDDRKGQLSHAYYQIVDNQQSLLLEENGRALHEITEGYTVLHATHRLDGNRVAVLYSIDNYPDRETYLQVINSSGEKLYPGFGISLGADIAAPSISSEGENIYIAWLNIDDQGDNRSNVIKGQRILNGQIMWEAGGKTITSTEDYIDMGATQVFGRYYMWMQVDLQNYAWKCKALLVNENGDPAPGWEASGFSLINPTPGTSYQMMFAGIVEGNLVAFIERQGWLQTTFIQKMSATGQRLWGDEGIILANSPNQTAVLDVDFTGGVSCIYLMIDAENQMKMQKFDSNGNRLFGDDGLMITNINDYWYAPQLVKYENNFYSVFWTNSVDAIWSDANLYQCQISPTGIAGAITTICDAPFRQSHPMAAVNGNHAFVAWDDSRLGYTGDWDLISVYGNVIQSSGTAVADEVITPGMLILQHGNYPNPFKPSTTLSFKLSGKSNLNLDIFNIKGQKVRTLASDKFFAEGNHSLVWDGRDNNGNPLSSGVYLYKLQTGNVNVSGKMLRLK